MQCPRCNDVFETPGPNNTCPTCNSALDPIVPDSAEAPGGTGTKTTYNPSYPSYQRISFANKSTQNRNIIRNNSATQTSRVPSRTAALPSQGNRPRPVSRPTNTPLLGNRATIAQTDVQSSGLTGTVIRVDTLNPDPPDRILPQVLFSIILIIDLVILVGWIVLVILAVLLAVWLIATALHATCLTGLFGSIFQLLFSFILPFNLFRRGQENQRLLPMANTILRAGNGRNYTVRIKGQLQGATPQPGDHVRVWGRVQHDILRLTGGVNLDTGEGFTLPFDWTPVWWILLFLLILGNIATYYYLNGLLKLP